MEIYISINLVVFILLLAFLQGVFEGVMDMIGIPDKWQLSHLSKWSRGESRFSKFLLYFTGPDSWKNKYKNRDPSQGEAFLGAKTFLVWLTDGWHLCKAASLLCHRLIAGLLLSIVFPGQMWQALIICFITLYVARGISFNIVYRLLHFTQVKFKTMKKYLYHRPVHIFAFVALAFIGVAIGQLLNPFIDPNFNPATVTDDMNTGDWLSISLPSLFVFIYWKIVDRIRKRRIAADIEDEEEIPAELDMYESALLEDEDDRNHE